MQVVQKRGVSQWGLGPYSKPSSPDATLAADSPRPRSPGPEVRPFAARADGFAEPPSLCPAPPSPPPPAPRASAYLALSAAGRGSGRLLSLSRPWGRDCTPNLPPPPTPGPGHPTPLPSSQLQGTELYYSPLVAAATRGLLAAPQISRFPGWGLSPHPMTPPSVPPPGIVGMRRHRPGPSLLP